MNLTRKPLEPHVVLRTSDALNSPAARLLRNGGYLATRVTSASGYAAIPTKLIPPYAAAIWSWMPD